MISKYHRAMALETAACPPLLQPREQGAQKAYTYGLVARALSQLTLPSAAELLGSQKPGEVAMVTDLLGEDLKSQWDFMWFDDPEARSQFTEAARRRLLLLGQEASEDEVSAYSHHGADTAMNAVSVTLATIQARTQAGRKIMGQGLIKSQRVPFALAMQGLTDLDLEGETLFEYQYVNNAHDKGSNTKVLRADATVMTSRQGLSLVGSLSGLEDCMEVADEPAIGCPATLVKHFIRDLHTVAAQACVQADIIPITES